MIGIAGQYTLSIIIGGVEDFIQEADLVSFTSIEEAGNTLPVIEIDFKTYNSDVLHYINEGNIISISFGRDIGSDKTEADYRIVKSSYTESGTMYYRVVIIGVFSAMKFYTAPITMIYAKQNTTDIISIIAPKHFGKSVKIEASSSDTQNWIQPGTTDKSFINELWMHSHISPTTFIALGITSSGTFILKDMKKAATQDPLYEFAPAGADPIILYEGDYIVENNSGFLNSWMGYKRRKHIFNHEQGTEEDIIESTNIMLAGGKGFSRTSEISERLGMSEMINENVHANYWKAFIRNIQYLTLFSNITLTLSFSNRYVGIQVLDLVNFLGPDISEKALPVSPHAGKYFISKVARNIAKGMLTTTVQMRRETLGGIQGSLS